MPLRRSEWVVHAKEPFAGPRQVLRYLSRYTHRIAISNRRLVSADANHVAFRWKDYRANGTRRWKTMTLATAEFIRRFLSHVLPEGFHRIRHYGLFANTNRAQNVAKARELLDAPAPDSDQAHTERRDAEDLRIHHQPCQELIQIKSLKKFLPNIIVLSIMIIW